MPIILDQTETKIFKLLLECVQHHALPVTLRVAGGWVRDKLLGLASHDIDIAIDTMMGRPFVDRLQSYVHSLQPAGEDAAAVHGVGTIRSNPEKSKHLETATMKLCGVNVDFVNLRSEMYSVESPVSVTSSPLSAASSASSSRIPTRVQFGSPLEDAQRRDITINSLFYNIHTGQVEDFCGLGLDDLKNGLIRTPLDPIVTLLDDPLRLLRVIRFAARFDYSIVAELLWALHSNQVHRAFRMKVSRERVGIEVDKMLSHASVAQGMHYLLHERIYHLLFLEQVNVELECLLAFYVQRLADYPDPRLAAFCVLYMPLAARTGTASLASSIRDGLKLCASDYGLISRLVNGVFLIFDADLGDPISVGRAILSLGEHWRLACVLADGYSQLVARQAGFAGSHLFVRAADAFRQTACFSTKPLLNGNEIMSLFRVRGKDIGAVQQQAVDLQLAHPGISKEELIDKLLYS